MLLNLLSSYKKEELIVEDKKDEPSEEKNEKENKEDK